MIAKLRAGGAGIVLVGLLAFSPFVLDLYGLSVITYILLYGVAAISLQLLWGRGGQLSFGHAAFFGIGAYIYAIFTVKLQVPTPLALLLAITLSALLALIIGYFLFFGGVRAAYFSVITLAIALIANQLAISWTPVTGGNAGLIGVPGLSINVFGLELDFTSPVGGFSLALIVLAVALLVTWLIHFRRLGLIFTAIREDETRAAFMGYRTPAYLTALLVISVSLAALAGAAFSAVSNYAAPDMLGAVLSVEMLTWVAVGGRNFVAGALVGVVVLRLLNIQISTILPTSWPLIVGGFFVLVVLLVPAGLVGTFVRLAKRLRPRRLVPVEES
ncbi:MAG: branched-chain amino acid ABC transporter permease [Pseudolysinimonas sp.]